MSVLDDVQNQFCVAVRGFDGDLTGAAHATIGRLASEVVEGARGSLSGVALADVLQLVGAGLWHIKSTVSPAPFLLEAHRLYAVAGRHADAAVTGARGHYEAHPLDDGDPLRVLDDVLVFGQRALAQDELGCWFGEGYKELGIPASGVTDLMELLCETFFTAMHCCSDVVCDDPAQAKRMFDRAKSYGEAGVSMMRRISSCDAGRQAEALCDVAAVVKERDPVAAAEFLVEAFTLTARWSTCASSLAARAHDVACCVRDSAQGAGEVGGARLWCDALGWARVALMWADAHRRGGVLSLQMAFLVADCLIGSGDRRAAKDFYTEMLRTYNIELCLVECSKILAAAADNEEALGLLDSAEQRRVKSRRFARMITSWVLMARRAEGW